MYRHVYFTSVVLFVHVCRTYVILRDGHSEPIFDHNVDDLHGCASAKTLSPTRRQSVILVVSDDLVMSKMFLQNPYTSSEIIDVCIDKFVSCSD